MSPLYPHSPLASDPDKHICVISSHLITHHFFYIGISPYKYSACSTSIHPPLNQYTYNNHCEIASIHPFVIHHLSRHALLSSCFISDIPISASHVSPVCLSPFPSVFLFRLTFFIRPNVVSIPRHWNISTSTYIQHTFLRPRSLVIFQHSSNLLPCSQSQILRPLSLSLFILCAIPRSFSSVRDSFFDSRLTT